MEENNNQNPLQDALNKLQKDNAQAGILNGFDKVVNAYQDLRKAQMVEQNKEDGIERIRTYSSKLKAFLLKNISATEESFITREINENKWILEKKNLSDPIEVSVYYHYEKYDNFLKDRLRDLKAEQNREKAELIEDKPLPFLLNRSQTVAFMVMLMDSGIINPMKDYRLAKFIEKNFLYDNDKPMKEIANEISQFRNHTKNPETQEEYLKDIFSRAKIKTKGHNE